MMMVAVVVVVITLGGMLFLSLKPIWRPAANPALRQTVMRAALVAGAAGILLLSLSRWAGV